MSSSPLVLVVDDEPSVCKVISGFLKQEKIRSVTAGSAEQALDVLHRKDVALVISDIRMPGMDGLQLLDKIREIDPTHEVILITAHGSQEIAREALRRNAADYIKKPFDRDEIIFAVRKALARREVTPHNAFPALAGDPNKAMIGKSAGMQQVFSLIAKVAPTSSTVLIRGESGTGKELVACALHAQSPRHDKPFVKVVCAALPETLIESELFGYEKGAFTGAATSKPGRFELAEGGTIFLDEIGDLSTATQVKLLRVLQDRQMERLGGTQTVTADVRILTATHQDLEALVKEGKFREDLFYRLNVVPITIPPLRQRKDDLPLLCDHFLNRFRAEHGKPELKLDDKAGEALVAHDWPGNIRELQNVLERLVILTSGGRISVDDVAACLPAGAASSASGGDLAAARADAEKQTILKALQESDDNRTRAARLLGISRRTLHNKLREYGIE